MVPVFFGFKTCYIFLLYIILRVENVESYHLPLSKYQYMSNRAWTDFESSYLSQYPVLQNPNIWFLKNSVQIRKSLQFLQVLFN